MKIASIDIGSNTVLLLLAESIAANRFRTIDNFYRMPRIGRGLANGEFITNESIERLFEVMTEYSGIISEHNCDAVILTATAAMRKAGNSDVIIKLIKDKYNWDVNIVEGKEEARLSFIGATSDFPSTENIILIDIGGGSTEVIYGNSDEIFFSASIPLGAVNLTEKYVTQYPISENEVNEIRSTIKKEFGYLINNLPQSNLTIAVAGTPTTLSSINKGLKEYNEKIIEGSTLSRNEIVSIIEKLKPLTPDKILENFGDIVRGRNDVIFTGALILHYLVTVLNIDGIMVSGKGIRYGAIADYLQTH